MRVVASNEAPQARPASPLGAPPSPTGAGAAQAPTELPVTRVDPLEQLQDFVIALLLRVAHAEVWPEPNDFESGLHRAILQQLLDGPAWPDVETALARLESNLGDVAAETLGRVRARDELNAEVSPEDLRRELDVRRMELRKNRLFRQHQALHTVLHEEEAGLSVAERQASIEQLKRVAASIGAMIVEQQRLGVVGTASWSIRRGQEILDG